MFPLLVLSAALAAVPAPQTLSARSQVDEVTVYQGAARVTRAAQLELPQGDVTVLFEALPESLLDESLGVEGGGSAKARVFGATVERVTQAEALSPEARGLQDKVRQLEDRRRALGDQQAAAKERLSFAESVKATFSQERAQNMPVRPADPKEWTAMADFVAQQVTLAREQVRKAEEAQRELDEQLRAAREELQKLAAKQRVSSKRVGVELKVDRAGPFQLRVSYLVPQASWTPVWDARLEPDSGNVELALSGLVSQRTGEDWGGVKLALSTAQPAQALYVPELAPRYLEKSRPQPPPMPVTESFGGAVAMPSKAPMSRGEEEVADEQLARPAATVQTGLLATTFTAPRRETVEGAGRPRKAFLSAFPLRSEVQRLTAPVQEQKAFLTTKSVNSTGVPLMAGAVNVFLGEEFLGRTQLPQVPAGDELKLAFGADERIKVERKMVERRHETAGLFGGDDVLRYRFRTTVKNLYPQARVVTLLDQLPVSRDESIKVKLLEGSTAPGEKEDPNKPGVRMHTLTLPPGAERVIELAYEVRFPRGTPVMGLE